MQEAVGIDVCTLTIQPVLLDFYILNVDAFVCCYSDKFLYMPPFDYVWCFIFSRLVLFLVNIAETVRLDCISANCVVSAEEVVYWLIFKTRVVGALRNACSGSALMRNENDIQKLTSLVCMLKTSEKAN